MRAFNKNKDRSTVKLNALFEVTRAINENASRENLFALYQYILKDQLGVPRLALFYKDEEWKCAMKYGDKGQVKRIDPGNDLMHFKQITVIASSTNPALSAFDIAIPVHHKKQHLAFVLLGGVGSDLHNEEQKNHLSFIQTLTNVIIVAIENKKLARENLRKERLNKELEMAAETQFMLFPKELPNENGLEMAGSFQPHEQVGGDYYDIIRATKDEYIFCMADVSGKGMAAALLMANFQANLRAMVNYTDQSLEGLVRELNKKVMSSAEGERFITFFVGRYNTRHRKLKYINAGHNPPLFFRDGHRFLLEKGCIGLGMLDEIPSIESEEMDLSQGGTIVCYTDGVVELEDAAKTPFEIHNLEKVVRSNFNRDMETLNQGIFKALEEYRGPRSYPDDAALLSLRVR